jgi:membrane protease YdiL (CAAX protease family)
MTIFFLGGIVCILIISYLHERYFEQLGVTVFYILQMALSALFCFIIPILFGLFIFGKQSCKSLFVKPPKMRFIKALGNFPSVYGLGWLVNLLVVIMFIVYSRLQSSRVDEEVIERSAGIMNALAPPNMLCGLVLFVYAVLGAAIFEEILYRGILLNVLKPYGNGFAILITGFLFGIAHGNFQQFTYTFVVGIALAYITIQTGSILVPVILHAMLNLMGMIMMLFMSTRTVNDYVLNPTEEIRQLEVIPDEHMVVLALYGIYTTLFIGLIITGAALAIGKLTRMKRYKASITQEKNELSGIAPKTRFRMFFVSVPAVLMLLLTVEAFSGRFVFFKIIEMLGGV